MLKLLIICLLLFSAGIVHLAALEHEHDDGDQLIFERGVRAELSGMPESGLKKAISALPVQSQRRALDAIVKIGIKHNDLQCLEVGQDGKLCFSCGGHEEAVPEAAPAQMVETAAGPSVWDVGFTPTGAVPISSPPVFNSKPGSGNIVYIDFNGDLLENRAWNRNPPAGSPQATINARAYNLDGDNTKFSNSEQTAIYQVWQRVSEDFAPFDINVTTDPFYDDENNRGPKIGHVLVTHSSDFGNDPSGGYAWTDSFGDNNAVYYQPALCYYNRMTNGRADRVAECVSHEFGHILGLGHDGRGSSSYYSGHGSGATSWAPIMGGTFNKSMTQWSNGDYYGATNKQDDEAVLLRELGYRTDDHGDTIAMASALSVGSGGTKIDKSLAANQGIILSNADKDVFSFASGSGNINIRVDPFVVGANTRGGNLDVKLRLLDNGGNVIATANPGATTYAIIDTTLIAGGAYYLEVSSASFGYPLNNPPSGYVSTHSRGQFFVSGTLISTGADGEAPTAVLTASHVNAGGATQYDFTVTYSDNIAIDVSTIDDLDIQVTGPSSFTEMAQLVSVDSLTNGTPRTATYRIVPPGGTWDSSDNGDYNIIMQNNAVEDVSSNVVAGASQGTFNVSVIELNPPVINSVLSATAQEGSPFTYNITATNSPTSYASSALPTGLSINTSTGEISGTPTVSGNYSITITATNAGGSDSEVLVLEVDPTDTTDPSVNSVNLIVKGSVSADTQSLTINGNPITFDASGQYTANITLPIGLTTITLIAVDKAGNSVTRTIEASSTASVLRLNN